MPGLVLRFSSTASHFRKPKSFSATSSAAKSSNQTEATQRLKSKGVQAILVFRANSHEVPAGMTGFEEAMLAVHNSDVVLDLVVGPEDIANIFFTSGTTGFPKVVVSTQRQLLTGSINGLNGAARAALRRGEEWPPSTSTEPIQKAVLTSIPLFHVTGCHSMMVLTTGLNGKIVLQRKWNVRGAVDLIVEEKVTTAGGLALIASELLNSELYSRKHNLEMVGYEGGPASKMLAGEISRRLGTSTSPNQGYGTTETNSTVANFTGEDYIARPSSTGLTSLVNDIKIVDPLTGQTLGQGIPGEIYIRGPNIANGYWKSPEATAEAFLPDGFYKTGDIGKFDAEGYLYIVDRARDIIIRAGENIASGVVENALYEDARLADVAVTAIPDKTYGELVGATVVPHTQHHGQVTERELIAHVASRLPKHMVPAIIHVTSQPLPRNANGKVLKKDLKQSLSAIYRQRVTRQLPTAKL